MKILSILTAACAAGTLFGQVSLGSPDSLDARVQVTGEVSRPSKFAIAQVGGANVEDQAARQTGLVVRFLGELASARGFYYELGGKLENSSKLAMDGLLPDGGTLNATNVKFTSSYWSLGAAYLAAPSENLAIGLHLEARGEALRLRGTATYVGPQGIVPFTASTTTTYLRPWARLSADYSFSIGSLRPYVGVEGALALMKTTQTQILDLASLDNRTLKSMAPTASGSVYLGMHF